MDFLEEERLRKRAQRLRERLIQDFEDDEYDSDQVEEPFLEGFEGLQDASRLDTTAEFESPSGIPSAEASAYHLTVRKAADLLDLQLPTKEIESNLLTEVLMPTSSNAEPLLPFHEAVAEPVISAWEKPATSSAVNKSLARRYWPAPGGPAYLSAHPTPESLVVQASCSSSGMSFPTTPSDRESKKQGQEAKKIFSSGSMSLKSINATCLLGRYVHALLVSAQKLMPHLSDSAKSDFREIFVDGQCVQLSTLFKQDLTLRTPLQGPWELQWP